MTGIELVDLLKIYPFSKPGGLLGRKQKAALLARQRAMPYTTDEGVIALQHFSATIAPGEFVVLLGPSGCGKTTLIRLIAGLDEPTLGEVRFDGQCVNALPPEERDVAMVFQNYSLYPHLSVKDNIAFPLRTAHMPREEIDAAVDEIAGLLGIRGVLKRLPSELSGGQLQRVAIARALVRRPRLFLLDEPFSNLDAPLRASLRQELKRIHAELGTTFLYVTHDQNEALSLATRILLLHDGLLVQDGTPAEVYNRPRTAWAASFVGAPQMNFFFDLPVEDGGVEVLGRRVELSAAQRAALSGETAVTAGLRPVHLRLTDGGGAEATLRYAEVLGAETVLHLDCGGRALTAVTEGSATLVKGQTVRLDFPPEKLHFFRSSDGERI
jgi:multiple sugar transport system ATP-binding protein